MATDLSEQSCPRCQQPIVQGATTCPMCGLVFSGEADPAGANSPAPAASLPSSFDTADEALPAIESLEETSPGQPSEGKAASLSSAPDSPPAAEDKSPAPALSAAPTSKWGNNRLRLALIGVAVLLVLSATGAGITYVLTRPQPVITATSAYQVGKVPAGSATTTLQVEGQQFAANSAITFLLDGQPAPGSQIVPSDENGSFEADLTITARWKLGAHHLTARDMNGNTTKSGVTVQVAPQGAAHTPGPNGAPADDTTRFILYIITVLPNNEPGAIAFVPSFARNSGGPVMLTVQGRPDPAGGAVCNLQNDDGQPHTVEYTYAPQGPTPITLPDGTTITVTPISFGGGPDLTKQTTAYTCSGLYQGGKISYTETNTIYQEVYSNGVTCSLSAPRISYQFQGAFTSPGIAGGTYSVPASSVPCSDGSSEQTGAETGTWIGILVPA